MENTKDQSKLDEYFTDLQKPNLERFKAYYDLLFKFNHRINLISSSTVMEAVKLHFADSYLGLNLLMKDRNIPSGSEVYDFGSGNGFPGLILAIIRPDIKVVLVERDQRKIEFLKFVASELNLENTVFFADSLEKLPALSVKFAVTRAMSALGKLILQANSVMQENSTIYHFKTDNWAAELAQCPSQVFNRWDIQAVGNYTLPDSAIDRYIIKSSVF